MTLGNSSDFFWNKNTAYQTVQVTPNFIQDNSNEVSSFLKIHVACVVLLVTNLDLLLYSIKLLKIVESHMIVYSGTMEPPNAYLTEEDRPMLMLERSTQRKNEVNVGKLYCPRETKSVPAFTKPIILPNKYGPRWINKIFKYINLYCSNPLSKQTLYGASSLGRITRNENLVGGYHVSLFWYLGEKFNFNAVYKADIGGYDVKTNSYRGMSKKVF